MKLWWAVLAFVSLLAETPASSAQTPAPHPSPPPPAAQAAPAPRVFVNDLEVSLPTPPEVRNGVLIAPLAPLVQTFGGAAAWDPATRTVTMTGASGLAVRLTVGQTRAIAGATAWDLPAAPVLLGGTVWGPAAAVLRAIGAYVKEDTDAGIFEAVSQVTGIAWRRDGAVLAVTISATGPVRADGLVLRSPDRLVLDLTSAVTRLRVPEGALEGEGIVRIRTAQFQVRPYVTRVVFDLTHPLAFKIATSPGSVTVALEGGSAAPPTSVPGPSSSPVPPSTASGPPDERRSPGTVSSPGGGPPPQGGDGPAVPISVPPPQPGSAGGESVAPEPLALPPLPEFADTSGAFHVRGATYDEQEGVGRVTIRASQPLAYTIRQFVYPDRLAIDISGGVFLPRRQDLEIGSDTVRNIVVSQFRLRPNLARVLVHLHHKTAYTAIAADGGRSLVVTFGDMTRRLPRGSAVIIDPGHGGSDPGAIGSTGLREADVTLGIGRMVKQVLERQGVRVTLTRTDDSTVALEDRPDLAQRNGGIVFVSIHANAGRDPAVAGTETYYKTPESQPLAALVQGEIVQALGEPDRGVRIADFYVIVKAPIPSVLVEVAFITNHREEDLLRDPAVPRRIAEAIARAVVKFLAVQHQETAP